MALWQGQKTPPVLLVDGYNVLGELAKLGRGGREPAVTDSCDLADAPAFDETARNKLELQLVAYSHSRGVKVRVYSSDAAAPYRCLVSACLKSPFTLVWMLKPVATLRWRCHQACCSTADQNGSHGCLHCHNQKWQTLIADS